MSVFIAISVVDTFALLHQFDTSLTYIVAKAFNSYWSLTHYNVACKLLWWMSATSQICSSYFILIVTLERFVSVRFPLQRAVICTKRRINAAIVMILVVAITATVYEPYYYATYRRYGSIHPICFCLPTDLYKETKSFKCFKAKLKHITIVRYKL